MNPRGNLHAESFVYQFLSSIAILIHMLLLAALGIRIIMQRPAPGVALAWILLIASTPYLGATIYLLIGERRIGHRRAAGYKLLRSDYVRLASTAIREGLTEIDWSEFPPEVQGMDRLGRQLVGFPTVCGSRCRLLSDSQEILRSIAHDIDEARTCVLIEFYIWQSGGLADEVLDALIRAAKRGVACSVLIDALGARPWWKTDQPRRLRESGVDLYPALPVSLFRTFVGRTDLRLHRKIVIVDGRVAWTGSMNLVDPRFFKQGAGVGEWVDAMVRLEGSVVVPLAATLIGDWILEANETLEEVIERTQLRLVEPVDGTPIQVVPSGPGESGDGQLQMILALINSARHEILMTTPYLVPDESLLRALRGAAARGVTVRLIVPEKVDSLLTRHAARSYFEDLLGSGIEIQLFRRGLLHTKSITVDGERAMFGTVNLDMRSFWLNYEVALYVYGDGFVSALRELQLGYIADSDQLDPEIWRRRSFGSRLVDNTFRLLSPLL